MVASRGRSDLPQGGRFAEVDPDRLFRQYDAGSVARLAPCRRRRPPGAGTRALAGPERRRRRTPARPLAPGRHSNGTPAQPGRRAAAGARGRRVDRDARLGGATGRLAALTVKVYDVADRSQILSARAMAPDKGDVQAAFRSWRDRSSTVSGAPTSGLAESSRRRARSPRTRPTSRESSCGAGGASTPR